MRGLLLFIGFVVSGIRAQSPGYNLVCTFASSLDCSMATHAQVCGSDGVYYTSECEFTKAHCLDVTLAVVRCGSVTTTTTTATTTAIINNNFTDSVPTGANVTSLTTVDMVADSNTTTVTTMATFSPTMPMTNSTMPPNITLPTATVITNITIPTATVSFNFTLPGSTTTDIMNNSTDNPLITTIMTPLNSTIEPPVSSTTVPPPSSTMSILCQSILSTDCPPDPSAVCGSDLVSYANLCEYIKARCLNPGLSVLQGGDCSSITTPAPSVYEVVCRALMSTACTDDGVVLCGTNNITYTNSCEFEKAKCQVDNLSVDKVGMC